MFLIIWLIAFIIVVTIFKTVANNLMSFIGADWYTFDAKGRATACGLISLVITIVIYVCIKG